MLNVFSFAIDSLLLYALKEGRISEIPNTPVQKAELAKEILDKLEKNGLLKSVEFYLFLRKLLKAPFSKEDEYRKTVRMIADLEGKYVSVDLNELAIYYKNVKEFLAGVEDLLKCKEVV